MNRYLQVALISPHRHQGIFQPEMADAWIDVKGLDAQNAGEVVNDGCELFCHQADLSKLNCQACPLLVLFL